MFAREGVSASAGIAFWAVVFSLFAALIFGWYAPTFQAQFGLPVIDLEAAFQVSRTVELIAEYGVQGRQAYLVFLTLDCLLPVAASLLLIAIFRALSGDLGARVQRRLVLFAALPAICDLVENTLHALMTVLFPHVQDLLARLAWCATAAKYACALAVGVVLLGLIWLRLTARRTRFN